MRINICQFVSFFLSDATEKDTNRVLCSVHCVKVVLSGQFYCYLESLGSVLGSVRSVFCSVLGSALGSVLGIVLGSVLVSALGSVE